MTLGQERGLRETLTYNSNSKQSIRAAMRFHSSVIVLLTFLKMKFSVMGRCEY
jgi:hypothetical protein